MADPVLHIKDSYYFEVPKLLYPYDYGGRRQFPDVWISLDPEFQDWEFERLYRELTLADAGLPDRETAQHDWHEWRHDHANFAKPFDVFLEEKYQAHEAKFNEWKAAEIAAAKAKNDGTIEDARRLTFDDYVKHAETTATADEAYLPFLGWRHKSDATWKSAKSEAGDRQAIQEWRDDATVPEWSKEKLDAYNGHLSGKILIEQPFATLRNLYEKESGFAISKYMVIELVVGLILVLIFAALARRIAHGRPPKGKLWNLLEVFLVFIRDQIARPVLGTHDHGHEEHGHEDHAAAHAHGEHHEGHDHGHKPVAHAHQPPAVDPATRFLPLLWTIFFFVLGCNLMGMVPWAGAPTAAWSVTLALALVTFVTVWASGIMQYGWQGSIFLNTIPAMELPWYMAIILKPMIWLIEVAGLLIKHLVLSVRLLANMVAGHLVILGVMGLAFGAQAALNYSDPNTPGWMWWITATIAIVGAAAFNILELFVAFLQAYIFTFLSALFIGSAIHKH
jgi:F-type H+-transporting ATPase subunit a